uniref:Uncharacterized protein n=1 Tax=Plectus sambesii TaxID=2011161 RepID=A0A914WT27_9BILA
MDVGAASSFSARPTPTSIGSIMRRRQQRVQPADSASPRGRIHSVHVDSIYHRFDRRLRRTDAMVTQGWIERALTPVEFDIRRKRRLIEHRVPTSRLGRPLMTAGR